jgi:molybdopterin-binding protein
MKYGARNRIVATVTSIKKGDVMSLVKFDVAAPAKMASVLTTVLALSRRLTHPNKPLAFVDGKRLLRLL